MVYFIEMNLQKTARQILNWIRHGGEDLAFSLVTLYLIFNAHEDGIWAVVWTKRTNKIITGSIDDKLKVWNGDSLSLLQTLEGHQLGVVSVDVNPTGTVLVAASTSLDSQIRLWDLLGTASSRTIDAGPVEAWTVCFSPDGRHIAAGSHSGCVNIWNVETGERAAAPLNDLNTNKGKFIMNVAYSPSGNAIAAGAENGNIYIFDATTGKMVHSLPGHSMAIRSMVFSPDSSTLITASDDKRINIYDV
ncbi:WD repeat-containing protein 61 [Nowakowskiella sp. JEL0078]|nr:WD repeat-containing protein 61 [Nowakowskiella sp. JEL0078]